MSQTLVKYPIGRVILHFLCVLRDHRWKWHVLGMKREFAWATIPVDNSFLSERPASERMQPRTF